MKTLYFECKSGISGDMTVASLLAAGVPREVVLGALASLDIGGYEIEVGTESKSGINAVSFRVTLTHNAHHHHVGLSEITEIINSGKISANAKEIALNIFKKIADAEGAVHGVKPEQVHFHEVGAVDSIVDIVSAAVCIDFLAPDRIVFSKLYEGCGFIECAHGTLPVPAPAVVKLFEAGSIPVVFTDNKGEMVTPTGAGIAATVGCEFGVEPPEGRIIASGCGAGRRDFDHPNILRALVIETPELVSVIQATVDDMTGEALGYVMDKLFEVGALDVYYTPVHMKKNRPGQLITVLYPENAEQDVIEVMFRYTSTIGLRHKNEQRTVMSRKMQDVCTRYGSIPVKKCAYNDIVKYHAEYDCVCRAAEDNNVTPEEVIKAVNKSLEE